MELWNRQIKLARYMLLGTVIVTVLNIVFLLANVDMYISYCAALPYYLVLFGKFFDNSMYLGIINGEFTATGLFMAAILLAVWMLVWWLAKRSRIWLIVGLVAVCADLLVLLGMYVVFWGGLQGCLWEALIHGAVIFEMAQGCRAWKQKEMFLIRQSTAPMEETPQREMEPV